MFKDGEGEEQPYEKTFECYVYEQPAITDNGVVREGHDKSKGIA